MKKLSVLISLAIIVLALAGCSKNTPTAVAEKSMQCIIDKDFEGYTSMIYLEPKEGEDMENNRRMIASMLQSKYESTVKKKGALKSFEAIGEEISEDGNNAIVKMKIVYDNGKEDEDNIKLIKDEKGEWKIDAGK